MDMQLEEFTIRPIGFIRTEGGTRVEILPRFRPMLEGLSLHSHIYILWWFSMNDNDEARSLEKVHPRHDLSLPERGVFATRSPMRPNPIALTAAKLLSADDGRGLLFIDAIDAVDGTPVIDIKPYLPSKDRIEEAAEPDWTAQG